MINPADARAFYFYTPAEVAAAREILRTKQGTAKTYSDGTPAPTFEPVWDTWARKVLTWYGRFTQLLRRYTRALKSVALAQVAIWDNMRKGYSVPRLLRMESHEAQEERTAPARWKRNPPAQPQYITPVNPKTQKHNRRAQVVRLTHHLQTATL